MGRLLLLTLEYPPHYGGVGRMYRAICRAMPPGSVVVWTPPFLGDRQADAGEPYAVRRHPLLAKRGWPRWGSTVFTLRDYLAQHSVRDVLVGQALPLGIPVWLLSLPRPLRYAVFVHGMDVATATRVPRRRWVLRKVLGRATAVLAANRYVARLVAELGIPSSRVRIVYPPPVLVQQANAATVAALRATWPLGASPVLLSAGRLVQRKGHDVVLAAMEAVWQRQPDVRYVILGDGPERRRLESAAQALSRPQQVMFTGAVDDSTYAAWLSLATAFIMVPRTLPGDVEGLGIVYLEAAYAGKPAIGSRSGGVPEAIVDGETGLLVPENDVAATAEAILRLVADQSLAQTLGQQAAERVRRDFTATTAVAAVRAVFASS